MKYEIGTLEREEILRALRHVVDERLVDVSAQGALAGLIIGLELGTTEIIREPIPGEGAL